MKHEEPENRVREDRQVAIANAGSQPQPDRRRFLMIGATALAAGGGATLARPRMAMAQAPCGLYGRPCVEAITPGSGVDGDLVTITGKNFSSTAMNNCVFVGGMGATADVVSATPISIEARIAEVPQAQSGDVTVIVGDGTMLDNFTETQGEVSATTTLLGQIVNATPDNEEVNFQLNEATSAAVGSSFDDATDKLTIGPITDNWQDGQKARVHFHFFLDPKWQDKRIEMTWNDPQGLSTPAICASIIAEIIKRAFGPDGTGIIDDAVSDGASICITKAGASDGFGSASPS